MKAILNSKFQKYNVIVIEDSYNDEDTQVFDEEYHVVDQTLEEIQEELRYTPYMFEEYSKDKGKQKVLEFEIGTCSKPSVIKELNEQGDHACQKVMDSLSEIEFL